MPPLCGCAWPNRAPPKATALALSSRSARRSSRTQRASPRARCSWICWAWAKIPQAFASALEAAAEHLPSDSAKARFYLLSADVWARQCRDTQGARAALSQAGMYGASPAVVARVARLLAAIAEDGTWYEEATRRLIAQGASESEHAGLWFELARARALRGERTGTAQALAGLAAAPGGRLARQCADRLRARSAARAREREQ